jgi:hypothetical protein
MKIEAILATALGVVVLAIAAFFGGVHVGTKSERADWQKEKLQLQEAQRGALLAEVSKRSADQLRYEAIARKASNDYAQSLKAVNADYAADLARRDHRLRIPATVCPGAAAGPAQAAGTGGPDATGPATVELPERIEGRLRAMTKRADALALQLDKLQVWVIANGFYGTTP